MAMAVKIETFLQPSCLRSKEIKGGRLTNGCIGFYNTSSVTFLMLRIDIG
jgi:hypothetical protein